MSNDSADTEVVGVLKIKRVGKSNTGMMVVNSGLMQFLEQLNLGVGDSLELVFDEKTKTIKGRLTKITKSPHERMAEYERRLVKEICPKK